MSARSPQDIAIIGMSCTFPGARDIRQYWKNIVRKVDAVSDPPAEWEAELFYDPEADANDRTYCKRGGYLGDLAEFAPSQYGVIPQSVDGTEPDHFLALRASAEALTDAGYLKQNPYRERTGVVLGRGTYVNRGNTTAVQHGIVVDSVLRILRQLHPEHTDAEIDEIRRRLKESLPPFNSDTSAGLVPNVITGRIANRLDLMGPNYLIDAACASSIVAIDAAARDLQSGRCDMAIAGGVHASTTPVILIIFSHLKALSKSGRIRPFDAEADGTLLGEGVGMVVLRRLEDAERDGDRIYAVLRGIGVASDGKALGLLAPRLEGEELALRRAYKSADCDPATVGLIEAHGTATLVGDKVELDALTRVFGPRTADLPRCALGSVKSMISHTMPASGAAGLIKAALALHHKVLPPTLHCDSPNPGLELGSSRFYLNSETRPWIHGSGHPRRAGVNAFGFGGVNSHAVLEEYTGATVPAPLDDEWDSELFVFSGTTLGEAQVELERVRALVTAAGEAVCLKDLAWTLNCTRPVESTRITIVATSPKDLLAKIDRALEKLAKPGTKRLRDPEGIYFFAEPLGRDGKVALLFPGEGAQYANMLADLCIHFPEVREWFDLTDAAFASHPRGYLPSEAIYPPPMSGAEDRLWTMDVGAEAVFTANQALHTLLTKLGLKPHAAVGHSTGEHTALLAAGVVQARTRDELIPYILGVNKVFSALDAAGAIPEAVLLAVAGADHAFLESLVAARPDDLCIALDNCPHQVVLCGSEAAIEFVTTSLAGKPAVIQRLPMGRAYHTPYFREFSASLRSFLATVAVEKPAIDLYSCVTADRYPSDPEEIRDLAAVQWASCVRFRETIDAMYRDGVRIFIECGPRGNLTAFLGDILRGRDFVAIPANVQHRSGILQLQHMLATVIAHGVPVQLDYLYERRSPKVFEPAAAPRKPMALRIAGGLQPMRLPEDFALPQRAAAATAATAAAAAVSAPPMAVPVAPAPASVFETHLANMRTFLQSQQQIMSAWMTARNTAATSSPVRPFATSVTVVEPGRSARVRHRFSLERERLFQDHTLGRQISAWHNLTGVSVVPFTVTMEILAEAASVLQPGKVVTGVREMTASRWIALDGPSPLQIDVEVQATAVPGEVRAVLRPVSNGQASVPAPAWAEAAIQFADSYPAAPAPRPLPAALRTSTWKTDRLYVDGMFHGASFRAVSSMDRTGPTGTTATMTVLPHEGLIEGAPEPSFLVDPIILDAAGQVVAFWSQEQLLPQGDIFPYRMTALQCFQAPPAPGTSLECRVFAYHISEREIHSDIEIVSPDGRLLYLIEGWHDRRFSLPRSLWDLRTSSGRSLIGRPWLEPVAEHGAGADVSCIVIEDLTDDLLGGSHGIWAKMLAGLVLGPGERPQWDSLVSATPRRRHDWLRGRCAAKDAVRDLVRRKRGVELYAADVEILPDAFGKPCVSGPWTEQLGINPVVSLTHTGEKAVAVCADDAAVLVGIDMEDLAVDRPDFSKLAFDAGEIARAPGGDPKVRREWLLRMWCAKEAAGKALGRGLSRGLDSLRIVHVEQESGAVHIELANGLRDEFATLADQRLTARTERLQNFIFSTIVYRMRQS